MSSGWPVTGAILAWIGGAMFVLGDGRRLHGFALATAGAGLAFDVGTTVGPPWGWGFAAVALATGLIRQASDDEDWGLGSAGSTPRITLALLSGPAAAWLGFRIFPSGSGWINAGLIVIMILATARLLAGTRLSVVLTAGSLFALLIGAVSSLTESHALQLEGPLAAAIVFAILGARVPKGVYLGVLICGVAVIATPGVVAAAALGWRLAHVPSPTGAVLLLAVGAVPLWALCGPNRVTGGHRQLAVMIGLAVIGTVVTATAISAVALVILLVAGGQAAWEGKSGVGAVRVRAPAATSIFLTAGALALHGSAGGSGQSLGVLSLCLGVAAVGGGVPFLPGVALGEEIWSGSWAWLAYLGPPLLLGLGLDVRAVIPGVDGAIYVGILLGIGLINLLWGVIGAWSNSALTWRYSILADWGLLLVALGLLSRGALGAAVLLIAWILLIKGPLMLLSISDVGPPNPSIDSGAGRGLTIVFGMMLVGGAPFIGFPIRLLILKAASGLYWPLAAVLGVLFLAWVGHGFKLARTLQIRPGRRRLAAYVILVLGTAIGLYPAGLLQIAGLA